jgi:hypothetical protein
MMLDIARMLLFPALMAFAASSDLFTIDPNRVCWRWWRVSWCRAGQRYWDD